MEYCLFIHFLSHLPGPFAFYTALENNTFSTTFFRFRGGGKLPPLRAPLNTIRLQQFFRFQGGEEGPSSFSAPGAPFNVLNFQIGIEIPTVRCFHFHRIELREQ